MTKPGDTGEKHHADYSKFDGLQSKQEAYEMLLISAEALVKDQSNWVANTANVASLLWHLYLNLGMDVNWAGFYVADPDSDTNQLILGPFHGQVACQTIQVGKGVCGTAASTKQTQLVPNVEEFPGHIACDGDTKSEIVVPILDAHDHNKVYGVIDIDCLKLKGFSSVDQKALEQLAGLLSKYCKFPHCLTL